MISHPRLLLPLLVLVGVCGGSGDGSRTDTRGESTAPDQAEEAAPLPAPEHLLFSRPLSLVEIEVPSEGSVISQLLDKDVVWVTGESYGPGDFKRRLVPERLKGKAALFRAEPRILPARSVRGAIEAFSKLGVRDTAEVSEEPIDPYSLEIGEMLIDSSGIYAMVDASVRSIGTRNLTYPTSASATLAEFMSTPPTVGQLPEVTEVSLGRDTRRTLQLTSASRLGWKLTAEDAGAEVAFSFGFPESIPIVLDESAIAFRDLSGILITFDVVFLPEEGEPRRLWQGQVGEPRAGRRIEARIDALPDDVEGGQLVLQTRAARSTREDGVVPAFWSEVTIRKEPSEAPPSVLVILLDTLRADRLGCYGYPRPTSPVLDELAARGAIFEDAWSSAPWTLPSHASLFSSLYMSEHGVWDRSQRLSEDAVTIAEVLRSEGYATSAFTASGYLRPEYGFTHGFDRFWYVNNDPALTFNTAAEWIEGSVGPYFSFVHTYHVHSPHDPEGAAREAMVRPYAGDLPELIHTPDHPWGRRQGPPLGVEDLQYVNDLYDAEILEIDTLVGELLDRLEAAGKLDDTLIIVTSDHGEVRVPGHRARMEPLPRAALRAPDRPLPRHLRGRPSHRLPDHRDRRGADDRLHRGRRDPQLLVGVALGPEAPETDRPIWIPYRQRETGIPATALRNGNQKYIYFPEITRPHDPGGDQRLYDLAEDAVELNDIWRSNAVRQKRWERAVRAYERAYPLRHSSSEAKGDGDLADQLKALGYGGG